VVVLGIVLFLLFEFASNRHRPDEDFHDVMACLGVLGLMLLWGLYRIVSRFVDALYVRFSK
jgi:glycopeptide antibiotics resistance protein